MMEDPEFLALDERPGAPRGPDCPSWRRSGDPRCRPHRCCGRDAEAVLRWAAPAHDVVGDGRRVSLPPRREPGLRRWQQASRPRRGVRVSGAQWPPARGDRRQALSSDAGDWHTEARQGWPRGGLPGMRDGPSRRRTPGGQPRVALAGHLLREVASPAARDHEREEDREPPESRAQGRQHRRQLTTLRRQAVAFRERPCEERR